MLRSRFKSVERRRLKLYRSESDVHEECKKLKKTTLYLMRSRENSDAHRSIVVERENPMSSQKYCCDDVRRVILACCNQLPKVVHRFLIACAAFRSAWLQKQTKREDESEVEAAAVAEGRDRK